MRNREGPGRPAQIEVTADGGAGGRCIGSHVSAELELSCAGSDRAAGHGQCADRIGMAVKIKCAAGQDHSP